MKRRSYRMGVRVQRVDKHRADILKAASAAFSEAGYHGVGLEEIAQRAGVSRKTVYYQFGSKMGLLDALVSDLETSVELAERVQAIIQQPVRAALREYFMETCRFWERNQDITRALSGLAATDIDAAKVLEKHDRARRRRLAIFVDLIARNGELRGGYPRRLAIDLLWLLSSFTSFDQLVHRSRLNVERAASLLADAASVLLEAGAT